jgi:phage terminase large subunit-like protein
MNAEFGIAEEICKWCDSIPEKIQERFDIFDLGVRSKRAVPNPQIFIASTPKPFPFFINFDKQVRAGNSLYSQHLAITDENIYLSEQAKAAFHNKYDGTRLGRQELYGELLIDNPNALWTFELLQKTHISEAIFKDMLSSNAIRIVKTCVAVDPAVSTNATSDETGIIASALCSDNKVYVLEDASGRFSPEQWSSKAVTLYHKHKAQHIILESNQGGNLLERAIKVIDPYARTKLVHASVGKKTRFEPVLAAYEKGEVMHVGDLGTLERQMTDYDPYISHSSSPDRADALAYTIYDLLLNQEAPQYRSTRNLMFW